MSTQSEGPGPMQNTRDRIDWDREAPRYVIVVPYAREKTMDGPQMLMEHLGEVKGFNVQIIAVGQPKYGERWDEYMLWGWHPPTGDPKLMSDRELFELKWFHENFALGFKPGGLRH